MSCNSGNLQWTFPPPGKLDDALGANVGGQFSSFPFVSSDIIQAVETVPYTSVQMVATPCECGGTLQYVLAGGALPPGLTLLPSGIVTGIVTKIFGNLANNIYFNPNTSYPTGGVPSTYTLGDQVNIKIRYTFTVNAFTSECDPIPRVFFIDVAKHWDVEQNTFKAYVEGEFE